MPGDAGAFSAARSLCLAVPRRCNRPLSTSSCAFESWSALERAASAKRRKQLPIMLKEGIGDKDWYTKNKELGWSAHPSSRGLVSEIDRFVTPSFFEMY